jgi:hypothetical protein
MAAKRPAKERFWEKVRKVDNGECWLWLAATTQGYGVFSPTPHKQVRAHRYAYEQCIGPIPKDKVVMHRCDVRSCLNPRHLALGTPLDNMRDKMRKGRQPSGERHYKARLTAQDVLFIRRSPEKGSVLARRFGVAQSTISQIRSHRNWDSN